MKPLQCARCDTSAGFIVAAGDPDTFWYRSESTGLTCLPRSRRWASFVGPVTVKTIGDAPGPVQGSLFDLPEVSR